MLEVVHKRANVGLGCMILWETVDHTGEISIQREGLKLSVVRRREHPSWFVSCLRVPQFASSSWYPEAGEERWHSLMFDPARATGGMTTVVCPVSILCVDASFNQEHDGSICDSVQSNQRCPHADEAEVRSQE